LFLFELTIKLN